MSAVTLEKATDHAPVIKAFYTRQWQATVDLYMALTTLFGRATGDRLYEGLSDNNPRTLADTLAYWTRYDNTTGELVTRRSGVSLRKITDDNPIFNPGRVPGAYVGKINRYMRHWEGPLTDQTRDDLSRNDLRGLSNFLYLASGDPTPGQ